MKPIAWAAVLLLAGLSAPLLIGTTPTGSDSPAAALGKTTPEASSNTATAPPWQVEQLPGGGSRVFGIALGDDTLGTARQRLGNALDVALISGSGQTLALEGHAARIEAGFVTGALVLGTSADSGTLQAMRRRAVKSNLQDSGARKLTLHPDDLAQALATVVTSASFIPSLQLDEAMIVQRFGAPSERHQTETDSTHLLYAELGLDVVVNARQREIFQYVAPRDFERLRAPLQQQHGQRN